jgi:hypothetical protein
MSFTLLLLFACRDGKTPGQTDGPSETGDTSDTSSRTDTDPPDDTGETGETGHESGSTDSTGGDDTGSGSHDDTGVGDDTGKPPIGDTGSAAGGDTGPGPEPDLGELVAQPKWQRMWGANDVSIRLDGRASYDPMGDPVNYRWTATNGTFDDDTSPTPIYTGTSGTVTLTVSNANGVSDWVSIEIRADEPGARIPEDYPTVEEALEAGETILFLSPGTYGPISGADAVIGDPDGGVIIDAGGADNAIEGASYLRHLTITGATKHGVYATSPIRLHDVVIEDNGNDADNGGGIYANDTVILYDSVVQNNTANLGGGIYLENPASLYAQQAVVAGNTAQYGGGVYTNSTTGNVSFYNALIVDNSAAVNGGAGVFLNTRAFLTRATVAGNAPGGIRLRYGYFEVAQTVFAENTMYAIDMADAPTVKINDCLFGTNQTVNGTPTVTTGVLSGDPTMASWTSGADWTTEDFRLDPSSPGVDVITTYEDRDGTPMDLGAYGGFLGRLPSGVQGVW